MTSIAPTVAPPACPGTGRRVPESATSVLCSTCMQRVDVLRTTHFSGDTTTVTTTVAWHLGREDTR